MDADEIAFLEEPVHGIGQAAAHAEHRAVEIGARPQVRDGAQKLGGVAFFLQRIVLRRLAYQLERSRLHFPALAGGGRGDEFAAHLHRGAGAHLGDRLIAGNGGIGDDLEVAQAGAVVEFDKGKRLGIAAGADPPGHLELLTGFFALQDMLD